MKYLFVVLSFFVFNFSQAQSTFKDWADLSKYAEQNATLSPPKESETRVVFLGSSIIEFWKDLDAAYFENHPYINRGISGQITPQMLLRFRADVINLRPQAVVILAGSNDLAQDTSDASYRRIMNNIRSMVEQAKYHHIKVFLCKYVPIADYPWRKGLHPAKKIIRLNKLIADYGRSAGITILDYFTPLANEENGQKTGLTRDGVHPNRNGYKLLEKVTDKAIRHWEKIHVVR